MVEQALDEPGAQEWTYTDENLANLVDHLAYWLGTEYVGWVTDPDDPEVKKARAERKRSGEKPPPVPIIPPVARRPPEQAKAAHALVEQLREHFKNPAVAKPGESKLSALDQILG
ncbi:hypothetical protein [Corynebacterium sanguinis]|uniref:Uncharacterized protein n=1 Tax=Corynebacterium sanguinis TaxID=2594913 RepID=A0A6C1U1A5_9CORY|nr:hypothetical protein [Corynebacterium sanguinis]TVS29796.1 hypothetical protein EKI59_02425 [Corynebacterium sanguinis]